MAGEWFTSTGVPTTAGDLDSDDIRNEFIAIDEATDKLPALAGSANYIVKVNSGGTGLESVTAATVFGLFTSSNTAELNILDGATLTTAELNYVDGVTSSIQTQFGALGTISTQAANSVNIDGGAIDGTIIGGSAPAAGTFTALTVGSINVAAEVTANTAKVTNATHTGDVTGATALTIGAEKVTEAMLSAAIQTKLNNTAPSKFDATAPPTVNDDSANTGGNGVFGVGSVWVDQTNDISYRCMDAATGAAVWINSNNDGLGTMSAQNAVAVTITGGTITNITDLTVADGGTGSSTAADARANLGLAIGTDVQAYDADTAKLDVIQTFTAAQTLDSLILGGTVSGADHILNRVILLDYGETVNIMGALGGGAVNIDLELGNVVSATVDTSATTITFTNPTSTAIACGITLWLTNGGSQTFSVTNAINKGGVAPTLTAAGLDKLVYETIDNGTTWSQDLAGAAYA